MEPETAFKALADRTRQRALAVLIGHELSVSELVEVLRQPQSTVSRHLKILREAELIRHRRDGTAVLYSARNGANARNGSDLAAKMLDWIAQQPVPPALARRLEATLRRRRRMSDKFFHEVGRRWDSLREDSFGGSFQFEALLALLPPTWIVADIGTGTGYLLPALANHFERVIGVEPVETMLEAARYRIEAGRTTNVDLRAGDLSQLPITDEAVDLALAVLVLHHVPSPAEALSELARIVRPGGCVLIVEQTTHENESFRERMQDCWWGFDPAQCGAWLINVGFERIRSEALTTVVQSADAPGLFVVTGFKNGRGTEHRE